MFFSVIVPVYNVAPYLRKCLDSLVGQTCKDKEIIVIDDGSTDGSGELCDEYATQYPFVTVIHQANQGVYVARNVGLDLATGEWIYFVDSDDWVELNLLERMQGYILASNVDLYRFCCERVDEKGIVLNQSPYSEGVFLLSILDEKKRFDLYSYIFKLHEIYYLSPNLWDKIYNHKIIREHNLRFPCRKRRAEDCLFNLIYILFIKRVAFVRVSFYHYLVREGSLYHTATEDMQLRQRISQLESFYDTVNAEHRTYIEENFYKLYFFYVNERALPCARSFGNTLARQIIDEFCQNEFHRRIIQEIRDHRSLFEKQTEGVIWFDENFGKEENIGE